MIRNATVISEPGVVQERQDILFKDGIITSLGKNLSAPPEAAIIVGDSLFVYPGFIDMASKVGVSNPPTIEKPKDFDSSNPDNYLAGIHPQISVLDHLDTQHPQQAEWRKLGFAMAHKIPMGMGLLPGKTAVLGYTQPHEPMVLMDDAAVYARFSTVGGMYPANNLGVMAKFRDLFENAKLLDIHQTQYASQTGVRIPEKNPVLESLIPATDRKKALYFETNTELDIGRALRLQEEYGFKLILGGVTEGEDYISTIQARQIAAVLSLNLPEEPKQKADSTQSEATQILSSRVSEAYESRLALAAKYEKAGISFAFTTKQLSKEKLFTNLRLLIEHGLSEQAALAALTVNPAKILGIERTAGDIRVGKLANFVLSTNPIFDREAQIKYMIVNGHVYEFDIQKSDALEATNGVEYWNYHASTPAGESSGNLAIWRESGKWKGEITIDDPEKPGQKTIPLEDIKKSATMLSFGFSLDSRDRKIKLSVHGDVTGASFNGTLDVMGTERFPFKAKRTEKPTT
ncbi:MAG: amidohydrolase family protein [Lunatimonas sp.]|uniref:amidohydrolase family protein n=1 Tax=Lunatimonas sp. TaxID=2060141 RepID=UPI00263A92E1|nr:amidohydrolase family protein [Lunatimonas sp.]MCC5938887.1 amidohydrolase family protein [Lunatimonas sp.]